MPAGNAQQRRERRVVVGGAAVVIGALLLTYVGVPFARQWRDRERELTALRAQADTLAGLVLNTAAIEQRATAAERALADGGRRTLHARSVTLAASALQSLLQDASDASHLVVTRLDVAPNTSTESVSDSSAAANGSNMTHPAALTVNMPATLAAHCDIVGLAAMLDHLARSPRVVYVDRVTVQQNSALRGAPDMLQITLTLRAPVVLE